MGKDLIEEKLDQWWEQKQKEGGKKMSDKEEFVRHSDLEISDLQKAKANLESTLAEQKKLLDDPVIARYLRHEQTCQAGEDCIYRADPHQLYEAAQKDGFEKGKTDAKSNLTVDDIPPKLVGEWIRVMRQKEGK